MKRMLKRILMIAIGLTTSSCATTVDVHVPFEIPTQCEFEAFTEAEKDQMIISTGKKIYRNQESCRIRQERIDSLITTHNETHK